MPCRATAIVLLLGLGACTPWERTPAPQEELATAPAPEEKPAAPPVARAPETPPLPGMQTGELMLRRTGCYGSCPAYTVFIELDGRVFYHGRHYAFRRGLHTGWVHPDAVRRLFETAIEDGYLETNHVYSIDVTDNPTMFTQMVAGDRRHWVRNYARAAPPAVSGLEDEIDALLDQTHWDRSPDLDPPDVSSCAALGTAIERRCDDVLRLAATGGDCMYWFDVWSVLESGRHHPTAAKKRRADEEQQHRCARHLQSLTAATVPPTDDLPSPTLGPNCRTWFNQYPERCRASLRQGEPDGGCLGVDETTVNVVAALHAPELRPEARESISEFHCERYTR